MPRATSDEVTTQIAAASSADEAWSAISDSRSYDGCDSSPAFVADVLHALLAKARDEEQEQWPWLFATYGRVAHALGLSLFSSDSIDAQLGPSAEALPWPTPGAFQGFQSRDPRARAAVTVALGYSTHVSDADVASLLALADGEADEGVAGIAWLVGARWATQLGAVEARRAAASGVGRLASCEDLALRVVAAATMAVAGATLPKSLTEALMEAVRSPQSLPREWGMVESGRTRTTADVALDVLGFARVDQPAERAVQLLAIGSSGEACTAAFQMTFVTPKESFPYGPVFSELTKSQLSVLKHAANASRGNFVALGIGTFEIGRFLEGKGAAYRPLRLVVEGALWVAHFGAVVRRVAIGGLEVETAARALVEKSSTRELLERLLGGLNLVAPLHPSAQERRRIEALLAAVLGVLRTCDPRFRERLSEALDQAHRYNSIPAHIAVALERLLVECGELPTKYEPHVLRALQDPGAREAVRCLLERLPSEHRERLVRESGARPHADLCLTRDVIEWLLREVTEENVEETLATLTRGSEETRRLLVAMRCEHELAETVRMLAEEALRHHEPARGSSAS